MYLRTKKAVQVAQTNYAAQIYLQNILVTETINKMYRFSAHVKDSFATDYFLIVIVDNQIDDYLLEGATQAGIDSYLESIVIRIEQELKDNERILCKPVVTIKHDKDCVMIRVNHDIA
jgi:hypothetical protein